MHTGHITQHGKQRVKTGASLRLGPGNEAENRPVLNPKVSCCLCNVFIVIFINLKIPRKS